MGTKIQINSLQALERLIGGDSEVEIEIRNSVVQEFTKRHLKAIADNHALDIKGMVYGTAQKFFEEQIGKLEYTNWGYRLKLTGAAEESISVAVADLIEAKAKEIAVARLDETQLNKLIDRKLDVLTRDYIHGELTRRFAEKMSAIKDSLNDL